LGEECHEHFIEEVLGKPICDEHTDEEKQGPSTAQRMFSFSRKNNLFSQDDD
jgi:hypothetical protein